ncbi:CDF family Co(II)/Ni(II) efflux transporter DmeF [soil metagenome]
MQAGDMARDVTGERAHTNTHAHTHAFGETNPLAERNTRWAVVLTAAMMVVEIAGGWFYNSMALLADGWHMSSHALALGLSAAAYAAARKLATDRRFAFGTWKIEILGGFSSSILLVMVALLMLFQSVDRLFNPTAIHYQEAIVIAFIGLAVNLICAWLLRGGHEHHGHGHGHHGHGHAHADASKHTHAQDHGHQHEDLNLRAAYMHVVADAATSVLAIVALFGGKLWGAVWLDPVMGILGAGLVAAWAYGLLRDSGRVLLDAEMDAPVVEEIREVIAASPVEATIVDLHVWRVARDKYACIVSLAVAASALQQIDPEYFKRLLRVHEELVHITVEINPA